MINRKNKFLQYVEKYTPATQLMRFMHLLELREKQLIDELIHHFLDLALKNNLVGCYKAIVNKCNPKNTEGYAEIKNRIQEKLALQVLEMKKNIVALGNSGNTKEQSHVQLKLAQLLFEHGEYEEVEEQLVKIKENDQMDHDLYYPLWMKNHIYRLNIVKCKSLTVKLQENQTLKKEVRQMLIGHDLREVWEGRQSLLPNTLDLTIRGFQLKNDFLTEKELGEYYSLLVLASGKRENAKKYVPWSARIEKSYIKMNYKALLAEVSATVDKYQFDPWIGRHIAQLNNQIRANVFLEVLKCYKAVQKQLIMSELGIKQDELQRLLAMNKASEWRYKFDPVTGTVHLVEKKNALLHNLQLLENILQTKQLTIIQEKKEGFGLDEFSMGGLIEMDRLRGLHY